MISNRQVVRLVTAKLDSFRSEEEAVLRAEIAGVALHHRRRQRRAPCRQGLFYHPHRLRSVRRM